MGFPCGSASKDSAYNAEDLSSIPGLGRSPGEGYGYPLQYSYPENFTDRGAWRATVHGIVESDMTERLTLSLSHSTLITLWPTCHSCLLNENHKGGEKGWIRMVGQSWVNRCGPRAPKPDIVQDHKTHLRKKQGTHESQDKPVSTNRDSPGHIPLEQNSVFHSQSLMWG